MRMTSKKLATSELLAEQQPRQNTHKGQKHKRPIRDYSSSPQNLTNHGKIQQLKGANPLLTTKTSKTT